MTWSTHAANWPLVSLGPFSSAEAPFGNREGPVCCSSIWGVNPLEQQKKTFTNLNYHRKVGKKVSNSVENKDTQFNNVMQFENKKKTVRNPGSFQKAHLTLGKKSIWAVATAYPSVTSLCFRWAV